MSPLKRAGLDRKTALTLAVTLLLWGSAVVAIRATLKHFPPGALALMRFLTAGVTLGLYAVPQGLRVPAKKDWPALTAVGLFGVTAYHITLNYGLVTVNAGAASMIVNTAPVFTALLATVLLRESLPLIGWLGMLVSLSGAALIAMEQGGGIHFAPGAWILLLSALAWSCNMVLQKPLLNRYSPLEVTTWSLWIGTIPLLLFAPSLLAALRTAPLSATAMLVYLGIVPIGVVYVLWAYVMSRLTASRAAGFLYLIPVIAIIVSSLWLGEAPGMLGLAGGGLVLAGVVMVNRNTTAKLPQDLSLSIEDRQ